MTLGVLSLLLRVTLQQECSVSEGSIFPRQIGGLKGDSLMLTFDYQEFGDMSRLVIGGISYSAKVNSFSGAGFLTYEDPNNF